MAHGKDPSTDVKDRLRERAATRRAAAHAERASFAGTALAEKFGAAFSGRLSGTTVSLYWPMRDEIDVGDLFDLLADKNAVTALPVMSGVEAPLRFRTWSPGAPLEKAAFGVHEPASAAPEVEPDIVGVPLLAFDAVGNRLGYGGGYYDRTLRALRARRDVIAVGICYDEQEFDGLPAHAGDERLDMILTDRRTIVPGQ